MLYLYLFVLQVVSSSLRITTMPIWDGLAAHFHGNKSRSRFHEESYHLFTQNIDFDTDFLRPLSALGSGTSRIIDVLYTAGA